MSVAEIVRPTAGQLSILRKVRSVFFLIIGFWMFYLGAAVGYVVRRVRPGRSADYEDFGDHALSTWGVGGLAFVVVCTLLGIVGSTIFHSIAA